MGLQRIMLGVTDIGAGMTSGTAGVCGFGVTVIAGATGGAVAVVQTWWLQAVAQKCEVWQEPVVWLL